MKRIKRVMVPNGDGEPIQIGHILQAGDGSIKIKIDSLPPRDFDGWVQVCEKEAHAPIIKALT